MFMWISLTAEISEMVWWGATVKHVIGAIIISCFCISHLGISLSVFSTVFSVVFKACASGKREIPIGLRT